MKAIVVSYECKEGMREAFLNAIKAEGIDEACRAEKGNGRYEYAFAADAPDRLFLFEKWETEEALALHREMPHFKRLGELKNQYVNDTIIETFEA
ncbi:MAG: antibiotic biosynthesis monooxygenase [Lachnospiraceae bacterium]|nr:antibiotic biosynthesis monooxygenase [Lachnospiraceae bacterium]MBQ9643144.1 antibiotic biosynthesis monooxygenase [Lachnospiraceae bacterium]